MNDSLYQAAQTGLVWRDMSHFGRFRVAGTEAAALLHHLTTQDIKAQNIGEARDAILLTSKGRILDWLSVFRLEKDVFQVVTSPNRRALFAPHAQKFILFRQDVQIQDETENTTLWGAFGPLAANIEAEKWPTKRLPNGGFLTFEKPNGAVSCDNDTFNILRVEAGMPVAGLELTEDINPWEANFEFAISLAKGCYNGQEIVARLHAYKKVKQRLMGLRLENVPQALPLSLQSGGKNAGFLTSAVVSPRFGAIGLGFVRGDFGSISTRLESEAGNAMVTALPFADESDWRARSVSE